MQRMEWSGVGEAPPRLAGLATCGVHFFVFGVDLKLHYII